MAQLQAPEPMRPAALQWQVLACAQAL